MTPTARTLAECRICAICGAQFGVPKAKTRTAKYCSRACFNKSVALRMTKHGMRDSREYQTWVAMVNRCTNSNNTEWEHYGGRGITVCERWRANSDALFADMGIRPPNTSIDRIDNSRGYEAGNCRWATASEQQSNRRPVSEWKGKPGQGRRRERGRWV